MPSHETTDLLTLRVVRSEPAADGIQLFEFRDPAGADLPPFTPGAHIAVRVPNGATRPYSLCNAPAERDRYVIAVKRDPAGRGGSVSLVDGIGPGDIVTVSPPRNQFELVPARQYIFVAGGIGITPIMAMMRALLGAGGTNVHLYYLTRSAPGTAFLTELSAPPFAGHVTIHHDGGDPKNAFDLWPLFEQPGHAHIYCCGPRPLMDSVRDMTGHWNGKHLHFEDFGADLGRPRADDTAFTVRLGLNGPSWPVPAGTTILETLRAQGQQTPSSCESGTCGTCRTGVLEGEPDHRDLVLTPSERRREMIICVSRARSPLLVLDL